MGFATRNRLAAVAIVTTLAACGGSSPSPSSSATRPGEPGRTFLVTVQRPEHGIVRSGDGKIDCGPGAAQALCGPVSYAWDDQVTLVATAMPGYMMGTWVGDCLGRPVNAAGDIVCVLDTRLTGADKWVGATFGPEGRALHPNFSLPAVHGPAFLAFIASAPGHYDCTACHGASYDGMGIAPSCNRCHADAGFPDWRNTCTFCHGAPPAAPHPAVPGGTTACWSCHPTTVDSAGKLIPGGTHMNGQLDGGGHLAGYRNPSLHARDFFEASAVAAPGPASCSQCHGVAYDRAPVAGGVTCNGCHADQGWVSSLGDPNWQTNCAFCHGTRGAATFNGFDVVQHPEWAAPPDAISQRLGGGAAPARTGAHQLHLTGSAFAGPFPCGTCHDPVPTVDTALTHIHGRDTRSPVVVTAPAAVPTPDPAAYDPATGTCGTYCHGATRSPAWSSTGLQCNGCHALPPGTPAHASVSSDLTGCRTCHPDTMSDTGEVIVAGGRHLNGRVDVVKHPDGYADPAVHGRDFFAVAASPTPTCTSCHGAGYDVPIASGKSCNSCHLEKGWATGGVANWRTNCAFCHGARGASTFAGFDVAQHPEWAAPPDAISQRLGGGPAPQRTGAHQLHLTGGPLAGPFPCATCHDPVPTAATATTHIHGRDVRSPVVVTAPGKAPDAAAYDPATGTCATYCHGASRSPAWPTTGIACDACHGLPPAGPIHASVSTSLTGCVSCHPETVTSSGTILPGGKHVNGSKDAVGHPSGYADPATHGRDFFATAAAPGGPSCQACHGAAFDAPIASGNSCNSCHANAGWKTAAGDANWQRNCSFCHGQVDATTQQGYAVADHPTWSAPPDAISQRLDGVEVPARTGAHRNHLVAGTYAGGFACDRCHEVPSSLTHISGRNVRAAIVVTAPGGTADSTAYDQGTGSCATSCHGAGGSPPWSAPSIACDGCHGIPPATTPHASVGTAVTGCALCHPDTVTGAGAIDVARGTHLNGAKDLLHHPPGYAERTAHGPQFLSFLSGTAGALPCSACHGTSYDVVMSTGQSCNSCHAAAGWTAPWTSNCTFCHGTRTTAYTSASLVQSSPPDGVSQRLYGTADATTEGKHRSHLMGRVQTSNAYYDALPCAACHAVPTDLGHVNGGAALAFTAAGAFPELTPAQQAALPSPLMTATATANGTSCAGYCHGATLGGGSRTSFVWNSSTAVSPLANCSNCHGYPPVTGKIVTAGSPNYCGTGLTLCAIHAWHINMQFARGMDSCNACHYGHRHVDGLVDAPVFMSPNGNAGTVTGSWDPATRSCDASCHTNVGKRRYWNVPTP